MNPHRLCTSPGSNITRPRPWLLAIVAALAVLLGLSTAHRASATPGIGPGICSNNKTIACSTNPDCGTGNTCYIPTAGGQTLSNQVCMQQAAGFGLNCTANDVNIAATSSLNIIKGCSFPGDTADVSFIAEFNLTAQDRYDIGAWIAQDGGNAMTGSCSVSNFPISPTPPWTNLDTVGQPTDTCGDITSTNNPLFSSIQNIKVACVDTNGDGNLDIATCLSWRQPGANDLCTSPVQAFPGSPSKCRCQTLPGIAILVPGIIKVDKITNPASDPTSFNFALAGGPSNINTPFSLTDAAAPFNSGSLPLGTYAVNETVPGGWTLTSATCTSDQAGRTPTPGNIVLHNGETVTCTFRDTLIGVPSLGLTKSASPATYNAIGQVILYSYVIQNTGNVTLNGPFTITDDKLGTVSCPAGALAPGATRTCSTASHTITQADLDAGSIVNIAYATDGGSNTKSNNATATVTAVPSPRLSLTKTPNPTTYDAVNQVVHYTMVTTNDGNVTLHNVSISDPMFASLSCTPTQPATLAPGASLTCTGSHTITQADLDAGRVDNTADASGSPPLGSPVSSSASASILANQNPHLSLSKVANPTTYDAVNQVIHYTLVATNDGNVTLHNVSISDPMFTALSCTPAQPATLAPGTSLTCAGSHTITQADLDAGYVSNTATGIGTPPSGPPVTPPPASVTILANQTPRLSLAKTASPLTYDAVNQSIGYVYVVTNIGNVTLNSPFAVTDDRAAVTCPQPSSLAPNASINCTATYLVTQADLDAGSVTNHALATASFGVNTVTSNQAQAMVNATQHPAMTLSKSASPSTYDTAGEPIQYTYVILNSGNVTLGGPFTVSDDKAAVTCPNVSNLAPGASISCSATYNVTQADLDAGSVTNHATATNGTIISNQAQATVNADRHPALSLTKSANPATYAATGDALAYTYVVLNSGNVTLSGPFTVSDDKATVTCPATGSLAPGASITCSATYHVTQADLDNGAVTNHATATNGTVTSNQAQATVNANQNPSLSLSKNPSPATYDHVGQVIAYSYVLQNSGNVTLHSPFTVSDDKAAVTCPSTPTSLAPGSSITCSATYAVTQADLDYGSVTNHATAAATFGGNPVPSNPAQSTVTAIQIGGLTLIKSADPATYASVGDVIHYSYVILNSGNVTLNGPFTVNDDKATVTCPAGNLAPNATLSCTASYVVTQADLDHGAVTNHATATNGTVTSNQAQVTVPAVQLPDLTLTKSADPATYDRVGQAVSYSYVLKNTGNVTLHSPFTVSDDKTAVTCPSTPTSLAPGASITCSASYTIKQADLDAGSVTNTATGQALFGTTPVVSNQDQATVNAVAMPALTINKSAEEKTYTTSGAVIHYTYVVTNSGNVTLHDPIAVSDDRATVTCPALPAGGLAPGASIACSATYMVTQPDLDNGSIVNIASAQSGSTTSPTDTVTISGTLSPALSLVKTAAPATYNAVNQLVSYDYVLKNVGNVTLSGPFTVSDDKTSVTCPAVASLAPGASITCQAAYAVTQADLDAGVVTNHANAQGFFGGNPVVSNPAQATVHAVQNRALAIQKTAQEATYVNVGDLVHYNYQVTNAGNVTLHDPITVNDSKATASCPALPAGGLAPGASINCSAAYVVTQADLDSGAITNIASATSGSTTSPTDTVTVPATQQPALSLVKSATPGSYSQAGNVINYSYVLKNTGNVTLNGPFTVSDDKAAVTCPATTSLAPDASITCSATYAVSQADLDAGSVTNHATSAATFHGSPVVSNPDQATVSANQTPVLDLTKSAGSATYDRVGQVITYVYVLKNNGNVTLNGPFTVFDDRTQVTCPSTPTSLAPGESLVCLAEYTITQADLDNGRVTNHATAQAFFGGNPIPSNPAEATVNAIQVGGITLSKIAQETTYSAVGDVIHYNYTILNSGNVTLNGPFTVSDDKVTVTCPATASLAPNATLTCSATYTIAQADLDAGSVANHATATNGTVTSNQAQATVPGTQRPDLTLTKSANPATYNVVGQIINYAYVLKNTGNVTLGGPFTVVDDKAVVTCPATTSLAPGASISCSATYAITQGDLNYGSVTNHAVAAAKFGDDTIPSNPAEASVDAVQSPSISLVKSASPATYDHVGQVISYGYVVKNIGNVTLPGPFSISDDKLGTVSCPAGSLAPGASVACAASYTIKQSDLDAGSIKNTATASTAYGAQTITSNPASVTVTAPQSPALYLVKSANPTTYSAGNQVIVYTYIMSNTGNVTLQGPFMINDDKLGVFQCGTATSLAPGTGLLCTKSYMIQPGDLADLSAVTNPPIPPNATITSAKFEIYSNDVTNKVVRLHRVIAPWTELGVTWNNFGGSASYDPAVIGTFTTDSTGWRAVDITALAQAWANGTVRNYGLLLEQGAQGFNAYDSSEYGTASLRPKLTVCYTTPSTANTCVVLQRGTARPTAVPDTYIWATQPDTNNGRMPNLYTGVLEGGVKYSLLRFNLNASITNRATASAKFGATTITTNQAQATISQVPPTARVTPTAATCSTFANGTAADLLELVYAPNDLNKINSVSPTGLAYYSKVTAPASSFTLQVAQSNPNAFPALGLQAGQIILYNASCATGGMQVVSNVVVDPVTQKQTISISVNGAAAGQAVYVGIKYITKPLIGFTISWPYPTIDYTFLTSMNNSVILPSQDSVALKSMWQ